jgi:putative FmdB family regulatory protein
MPVYDYDCAACGRRFEAIHGVHAEGPAVCQLCGGGPVRKAVTAAAVHYRGSGWAKKERRSVTAGKPTGETNATSDAGSGDAGATDGGATDAGSGDAPVKAPPKEADAPTPASAPGRD